MPDAIATFRASVRRPRPSQAGMTAELWAANGPDADAVLLLGRSGLQDAYADVTLLSVPARNELGGFRAYVRRPLPRLTGMIACFFAENGEQADAVIAMSLSKFVDAEVMVEVRILQRPDGAVQNGVKADYGIQAAALWRSRFVMQEQVVAVLGTSADYLAWLALQPCTRAAKGKCSGLVQARLGERMRARQAWPLCDAHSTAWPRNSENSKLVMAWAWERLRRALGADSMSTVPPNRVLEWAQASNVAHLLPAEYREAAQ